MKTKTLFKRIIFLSAMLLMNFIHAQTTIKGSVVDEETNQPLPGVNIVVKGTYTGVSADFDGNFTITTDEALPITLEVSYLGFGTKMIEVTSADSAMNISLVPGSDSLDEIVVAASRFAQRIFESPITVEKFSAKQIQQTPSADFFNGLENIKGIQLQQGGLFLNQVVTRGFATVYNEGFVTLVDMMNNMSPLFGFAMGNLIGLNELDVQSVEVIPGPASALYGADAYKGIMFLNSKNPFEHEGISAYYRTGVTEQEVAGQNSFTDIGVRLATKLGDKWAVKASLNHKKGTEWMPADYSHQAIPGGEVNPSYSKTAPDYNGLNIYGERLFPSSNTWGLVGLLNPAAGALAAAAPNYFDDVMSTGYQDRDLISNVAENSKGMFAVHFRPDEKTEISLTSLVGRGDSPLQGFGRYSMRNIQIEQHKLQIDRGRLNLRAYYTREQDGDSYQLSAAGGLIANSPNSNIADLSAIGLGTFNGYQGWFVNYNLTYMGALAAASGLTPDLAGVGAFVQNVVAPHIMTGGTDINQIFAAGGGTGAAHNLARAAANAGMIQAGTAAFETALNSFTSKNLPVVQADPGAGIFDDTKTYNYELNYDLSGLTGNVDFLVGGSVRKTELNSKGTIYSDQDGPIEYTEMGAYVQGIKKIFNDKVNLTGSLRVDKHEFFDANLTPRIAALINVNENQNFRLSFQTGFRNPTNQDQYIGLFAGDVTLLGSSPDNITRYNGAVALSNGSPFQFTGDYVFNNSYNEDGTAANLKHVTAEKITSFDIGYRFKKPGFTFDISAYLSDYSDKIGSTDVYTPAIYPGGGTLATYRSTGHFAIYQVDSNSDEEMKTYGVSAEMIKALSKNFIFNVIYDYNKLDFTPTSGSNFEAAFNTPEHNLKAGLVGNFNKLSFNLSSRYTSEYYYEASFVDGMIDARTVIDAQVSYQIPSLKAVIKVGGNNLGGKEYQSVLGGGRIGSIYYTSINFDF
ncbi:MAG: TonB-dependent receptor [Flavobacteriaceae bacterium]|nr:TonB-dependent receptor [Flavobacteriaceae bacterium]MDG1965960.1 TonB-dependent receptor [Flavobacteriaceae bacterium]